MAFFVHFLVKSKIGFFDALRFVLRTDTLLWRADRMMKNNVAVLGFFWAFLLCAKGAVLGQVLPHKPAHAIGHIPLHIYPTVVISSKYFMPGFYGQPYEGLATTVSQGLRFIEETAPNDGIEALLTGIGLFVRYGVVRLITSAEIARTLRARDFPLEVVRGNEHVLIESPKKFELQSAALGAAFGWPSDYVSMPDSFYAPYPVAGKKHISDGLDISSENLGRLETVVRGVSKILQDTDASDAAARYERLNEDENISMTPAMKGLSSVMQKAFDLHGALLYGKDYGALNVGPGLAQAMLDRALDSEHIVDPWFYIMARLDGLRYMNTAVARSIDRLGWIYGGQTNLYSTMMKYTALATLLSPGVVARFFGENYYIGGVFAWPDLNVWLSKWGVSGSVETRVQVNEQIFILLGYEGLMYPFANVDHVNYTDIDLVLRAMGDAFAKSGNEALAREVFAEHVAAASTQEMASYAMLILKNTKEYIAQKKGTAKHKVYEITFGATVAFNESIGFKAKGIFCSSEGVPIGMSAALSFNKSQIMSVTLGVDSLSPNSLAGNRMFVYNPELADQDRETAFWMELAVVC